MAEYRTLTTPNNDAEPWQITSEQYRYDALGRRILVRTRNDCSAGGFNGPVAWCSLGTIRRTVWDGDAELYEIQMVGNFGFDQNLPPSWSLENDTLPWVHVINSNDYWEGDRAFGRVAYTYGTTLDQPLSIVRIQFGDTLALPGHPWRWWPAFAVIPHWNWRGEADYGTLGGLGANNGGYYTCWPGETNRCIGPLWRPRLFSIAQQRPDTAVFQWYGTLLAGKEDGAGLQYHRNRYVDPATGRFTQEDPIGLAGGINVYGFANGDPVTYGDPFGAQGACKEKTAKCTHERIQRQRAQDAMHKYVVKATRPWTIGTGAMIIGMAPAIGSVVSGAALTGAVATPYGLAVQSQAGDALALRQSVASGQEVFRAGNWGQSAAAEGQFWSAENPLSPGYASQTGAATLTEGEAPGFVMGGTVGADVSFITRTAGGLGANVGGGLEVVVPSGSVRLTFFSSIRFP